MEVDTGLAPRTPFVMGRKCTEDERSESEGTFERSENPKGAQACASGRGKTQENQKLALLAQDNLAKHRRGHRCYCARQFLGGARQIFVIFAIKVPRVGIVFASIFKYGVTCD